MLSFKDIHGGEQKKNIVDVWLQSQWWSLSATYMPEDHFQYTHRYCPFYCTVIGGLIHRRALSQNFISLWYL